MLQLANESRSAAEFRGSVAGVEKGRWMVFPMSTAVVNEHNQGNVQTAQPWAIEAIVNGITTEPVIVTSGSSRVVLFEDEDGFMLAVS